MIEVFGTATPDQKQKHRYFFNKWMEWKPNSYNLEYSIDNICSLVRQECRDLGLREFWDYQVRPHEIRFRKPEYLAMWRLAQQ